MRAFREGPIKLVIVEPEGLYRDLLGTVLSNLNGLEVVGSFATGDAAARMAESLKPEVAVLDLELTGPSGIQSALKLRQKLPSLGVVLLSSSRDMGYLSALSSNLLYGWCYLIDKSAHDVTAVGRAVHVTAARLLSSGEGDRDSDSQSDAPPSKARLSLRQTEILGLVSQGLSNAAVAEALQLKEKTIENQLALIYERLDIDRERSVCHPRVSAVLWYLQERALRLGITSRTEPTTLRR